MYRKNIMCSNTEVHLKIASVLNVPLQTYTDDFTFIVNGSEFKTSRIVSDLISPKISQYHQNDPLLCHFVINTKNRGNFSNILHLSNFSKITIPDDEIDFFSEVIEILGNDLIDITNPKQEENVLEILNKQNVFKCFYSTEIAKEIDFISSNFYKLCDSKSEELKKLSPEILERIISNPNLQLKDEDQLVKFINSLYLSSKNDCSFLYEYVLFTNVESSVIDEFADVFNFNDLTSKIWISIISRLKQTIKKDEKDENVKKRYIEQGKMFSPQNDSNFDGILKYFVDQTNGNINEKVKIKASSFRSGRQPSNVVLFKNTDKDFCTNEDKPDHWIGFEFKENRVIPTSYQIMSFPYGQNSSHLKNWVVEGSNDNSKWEQIDSQKDCSYLNGQNLTHLFAIPKSSQKEFRFIRLRQTGKNWYNDDYLTLNAFELYGKLI